jgi:hypothetical protein
MWYGVVVGGMDWSSELVHGNDRDDGMDCA